MADSVVSPQSRPPRAASKKRRQATVSTETEHKLARAARSAQRLAQLSDASRDGSTLDLFPDDPTLATLEAMNIDIRQGTLRGFELPDVVLAAVGAIDTGEGASSDAKARRASRAARADESAPVNAQLSGLEIEPMTSTAAMVQELAFTDTKPAADAAVEEKVAARNSTTPVVSAMAASSVARSVTALRQISRPDASTGRAVKASASDSDTPSLRGFSAKAVTASREIGATEVANNGANYGSIEADGATATAGSAQSAGSKLDGQPLAKEVSSNATASAAGSTSADANSAFAAARRETRRAEAAALRIAPELDRARATAFADTVDALYGVIADQRRAATDHSRRMKWMLSIVVGALLVTVAIGITQTLLLMRLTRETTAQQHRIEQMMQNQQTALASLLDTHLTVVNAAAVSASSAVAPQQAEARGLHAHKTDPLTLH